ncbi:hypothetical protein VCV18_004834 [Metarhizium anisopliae]
MIEYSAERRHQHNLGALKALSPRVSCLIDNVQPNRPGALRGRVWPTLYSLGGLAPGDVQEQVTVAGTEDSAELDAGNMSTDGVSDVVLEV